MRWMKVLMVIAVLAGTAGMAQAQLLKGMELTPTFGYRWGGGLSTITGFREIETQDTYSYGVSLGKTINRQSGGAVRWMHFEGDVDATTNGGIHFPQPGETAPKIKRDDIMLEGTWYAYRQGPTAPFITAGLGAAVFSGNGVETVGRFAWNLGAGIRRDLSESAALRLQGVWTPVWITTGSGIYCQPWYPFYCYGTTTGEFYDQFEVSIGLALKLGH